MSRLILYISDECETDEIQKTIEFLEKSGFYVITLPVGNEDCMTNWIIHPELQLGANKFEGLDEITQSIDVIKELMGT